MLNPGTHSGTGQLGYHKNMGSIDDCLQLCEAEEYCCAFEYSDSKKRCYLNVDCNPTKGVHKDYKFCMKEAGKLMFCIQKISKCLTFASIYNSQYKVEELGYFFIIINIYRHSKNNLKLTVLLCFR